VRDGLRLLTIANTAKGQQNGKYLGTFFDHDDGTATDPRTGLMWMRAAIGQSWSGYTCVDRPTLLPFPYAQKIISGVADHRDWRLPSVAELSSLIGREFDEEFENLVFPNQSGDECYFWTDSGQKVNPSLKPRAASRDIHTGNTLAFVRLVRSDNQITIITAKVGSGNGEIVRSLVSDNYPYGVEIALTAKSAVDSKFIRWHGDASGQDATYTVTMDCAKTVSAEFTLLEYFALYVQPIGSGSGLITLIPKTDKHIQGSTVKLTARPAKGSKFVGWHGDASGQGDTCTVTMDSIKNVSAEFVALETFSLTTTSTGSGSGEIDRSHVDTQYVGGTRVILTARPSVGSKFKCWQGDATGPRLTCGVTMDSIKSVSAEFVALENFSLTTVSTGAGTGKIERSIVAKEYVEDTKVTLTARANAGSKFRCWHGSAKGTADTCIVTMDGAKNVSAEFFALESFALEVTATGTGRGSIARDIDSASYFADTKVTLTALAEEGSIFNGWHGDVEMLDDAITVTMKSAYSISAEFVQLDIAELEITAELISTTVDVVRGYRATVFRLMLRNNGDQQVRIKVPLTSYVSQSGQTSEQSSWAAGLVNGSKGVTLSTGTFCEMGLVHLNRPAKGDRLNVTVEQVQPSKRICFTFQCTGDWDDFLLISASLENQSETKPTKASYPAMASALKRIDSLESTLAEVLRRLDAIQQGLPMAGRYITPVQTGPVQTLPEVWAWVAEHERISVAELRARLLPLDLLPGAAMDELNERALDLTGEIALAQVGDEVIVTSAIFDEVLANWDLGRS
jgi:hypothetical protein